MVSPAFTPKQERYLELRRRGGRPMRSLRETPATKSSLTSWRRNPVFKAAETEAVAFAAAVEKAEGTRPVESMDLVAFRREILGRKTYPHMAQWAEWMEDPAADHILIVTAPECGKTTFLKDYCLWRIARDPTIRIAYASRAQKHAIKVCRGIEGIIEHNDHLRTVAGEMRPDSTDRARPWSADRFMVAQRPFTIGEDEVDYTFATFGMDSQIEGSRIDLFIVDDPDGERLGATERERNYDTIQGAIESRLGVSGRVVVLLNRWAEDDVAGRIMAQAQQDPDLWRVYTSPAIIEERDSANDADWGEVIWPEKFGSRSKKIADHWTPRRAWEFFANKRRRLGKRKFGLIFQNDTTYGVMRDFPPEVVVKARERGREAHVGLVPPGSIVVCTLDPATVSGAAVLAYAVSPGGGRQIVDLDWGEMRRERGLIEWLEQFGRYHPRYWGIEAQGPWKAWAASREVRETVERQGALLEPMPTPAGMKQAADIGIGSMVDVVESRLVIPEMTEDDRIRMRPLISQLLSYAPDTTAAYDAVIALWLAERLVREKRLDRSVDRPRSEVGISDPLIASRPWLMKRRRRVRA